MIVAERQLAELPAEALLAGVVLARGAPAVAAPIAEALRVGFQRGAVHDVDRAAFAHREVVRGIKRLRGDVAPRAREARDVRAIGRNAGGIFLEAERMGAGDRHRVRAAKRVAVVLDQPEFVASAKFQHGTEIEGVAQRVGDHHGLRFSGGEGGFELIDADVAGGGIVVDEDGHGAGLDDRGDGGGEAGGDGDDFVAGLNAAGRGELVGRERGEGDEVGGGAGVDEERVLHAEERGELGLKRGTLGPERQPEIERGRDGGFDLVFVEDATGVGHGGLAGHKGIRVIGTGAVGAMGERGIFAREAQDF